MYKYEVGQIIPAFMGHAENVYFNMDNGGATMFVFFQSPTMKEIEQFKSGKEFQIRFVELYDVIMLMAKIGDSSGRVRADPQPAAAQKTPCSHFQHFIIFIGDVAQRNLPGKCLKNTAHLFPAPGELLLPCT